MQAAFTFLLLNWGKKKSGVLELLQHLHFFCSYPDSQHGPCSILHHIPALVQTFPSHSFLLCLATFLKLLPTPALPFFSFLQVVKKVDCSPLVSLMLCLFFLPPVSSQLLLISCRSRLTSYAFLPHASVQIYI